MPLPVQPVRSRRRLPSPGGSLLWLILAISGIISTGRAAATPSADLSSRRDSAASDLVREGLAAEARFETQTALEAFLRADTAQPNDPFILQKISRQYSDLADNAPATSQKKRLCTEALAYAQRATDLQPDNAVNVLSLAICHGKLGLYSGVRSRIEHSRRVRDYAERALQLNPDYDYAHHVLGRWHYEVASLGAGTRFLVKLIYGGLPPATTADAVRHLRRAVELSPDLPAHQLELGFALLADGQRQAARETFERALALPKKEIHEAEARARARAALEKLDGE
ncbi:MAG TPA: hypothetical protein VL069_13375 [Opitutus sp.]|nr:hypothetical protein [Opitutus sp.]